MSLVCQRRLFHLWPNMKSKIFSPILPVYNTVKTMDYLINANKYYDLQYSKIFGVHKWKEIKKFLQQDIRPGILVNCFGITEEFIEELKVNSASYLGHQYNFSVDIYLDNMKSLPECDNTQELTIEEDHVYTPEPVRTYDDSSRLIPAMHGLAATSIVEGHIPSAEMRRYDQNYAEETDAFTESIEQLRLKEKTISEVMKIGEKKPLPWPGNFQLYSYLDYEQEGYFPEPFKCELTELYSHYECDICSLLPIIALDLQKFDRILDLNAEENSSLLILQTLHEVSIDLLFRGRIEISVKTKNTLQQYIPEAELEMVNQVQSYKMKYNFYNKVLCTFPSLNDRRSLTDNRKENLFTNKNIKKRMGLCHFEVDELL